MKKIVFIFLFLNSAFLWASTFSKIPGMIPLNYQGNAATDLIYKGQLLFPNEAEAKYEKGEIKDLSLLDPDTDTSYWGDAQRKSEELKRLQGINLQNFQEVEFNSLEFTAIGSFMFSAKASDGSTYKVRVGRLSHNLLLRKALLEKLGYVVPPMKHLKTLKVNFSNIAQIKSFVLDKQRGLKLRSRGDADRWIVNYDKNFTKQIKEKNYSLVLQDVVIMPYENLILNLALGDLDEKSQGFISGKRVFNSLLVPYVLADMPESLNKFKASPARVANNHLYLSYGEKGEYTQFSTTYEDARWIMRKISKLCRRDFVSIVGATQFPKKYQNIVVEKLIARRNELSKVLKIDKKYSLACNDRVSAQGEILVQRSLVDSLIKEERLPGFGRSFSYKAKESPLTRDEVYSFFKSKLISSAISSGIAELNKRFLYQTDINRKIFDHNLDLAVDQFAHFIRTKEVKKVPFAFWSTPVANTRLLLSRDLVVGSYLGSDNKMQQADMIGYALDAGWFIGADGLPSKVSLSGGAKVYFTHSYTHLKPVTSIRKSMKQAYRNIIVPMLIKQHKNTFDKIIECLNVEGCISEKELIHKIDQIKKFYAGKLKYKNKNCAIEFFSLSECFSENRLNESKRVLSKIVNNKSLGKIKIEFSEFFKKTYLNKFKDQFKIGESLIINREMGLSADISAGYHIDKNLSARLGVGDKFRVILSRLHIVRVSQDNFQIYEDKARVNEFKIYASLRAGIPIFDWGLQWNALGKAQSKIYNIRVNEKDSDFSKAVSVFSELMSRNSKELLRATYKAFELNFNFSSFSSNLRLLLWEWLSLKTKTDINIKHPAGSEKNFVLYSQGSKKARNIQRVVIDVANELLSDKKVSLSNVGSGRAEDSYKGRSVSRNVDVEVELDKKNKYGKGLMRETLVNIQYSWRGWSQSVKNMKNIFQSINNKFSREIFKKSDLNTTKNILLYNLETNFRVYNEGVQHLMQKMTKKQIALIFKNNLKEEIIRNRQNEVGNEESPYHIEPDEEYTNSLLRFRSKYWHAKKNRNAQLAAKYISNSVSLVENVLKPKGLDKILGGPGNYYFSGKLQGFREGSEKGESDFIFAHDQGRIGSKKASGAYEYLRKNMTILDGEDIGQKMQPQDGQMRAFWIRRKL